jgi:hypothetical protein
VSATPAAALPVELFDGTNPIGTTSNPLIEGVHKSTQILTTTPLGANGTFVSAWFDTLPFGDMQLTVTVFQGSTGNLATNGFQIQTTDDTSNSNTQLTPFSGTCSANLNAQATIQLLQRYWRVSITNGTTLQTSFEVTATISNVPPFYARTADNNFQNNAIVSQVNFTTSNLNTQDGVTFANQNVPNAFKTGSSFGFIVQPTKWWWWNGATWNIPRTPIIFKTVSATAAGNTAVWTPAAGKKFRLMRYRVMLTENATLGVAGIEAISFQDSATPINIQHDLFVPTSAGTAFAGWYDSGWTDLGNGILSSTINNVLNVNLGTALTAGNVRVNVCGTEE